MNVIGTFNVIRLAAELMADNEPNEHQQRGLIVNTAHVAAFDGGAGDTANAAASAAIAGMSLPLARDFQALGIRVMAVALGPTDTEFYTSKRADLQHFFASLNVFPQRLGRSTEFAQLVRTIIENPMLNADTIRLDAGHRYI